MPQTHETQLLAGWTCHGFVQRSWQAMHHHNRGQWLYTVNQGSDSDLLHENDLKFKMHALVDFITFPLSFTHVYEQECQGCFVEGPIFRGVRSVDLPRIWFKKLERVLDAACAAWSCVCVCTGSIWKLCCTPCASVDWRIGRPFRSFLAEACTQCGHQRTSF